MTLSPKNMRKNETQKLERPAHLEKSLYTDILECQQADASGYFADTVLICDGGTIKIHAFILQAASPFFRDAIASQGIDYPHVREVMLPDFFVKEIERMLTLVYKGYVDLKNDQEVQNLEETLAFFSIKWVVPFTASSGERDVERFIGRLKVEGFNRIPQDISKANTSFLHKTGKREGGTSAAGSRNGRNGQTPIAKRTGGRLGPTGASSHDDAPPSTSNGPANHLPANSIRSLGSKPRFVKPSFIEQSEDEDLETDEEDKDWAPPNYNDKSWMTKEALRCQACNKQYKKHGEALSCVTSKHKALRCYFCFTLYSSTEILFRHFAKRHKQAVGREKTLMCHYCDSMVPYTSVSCHVINVHLKTSPDNNDSHVSNSPRPGRSRTIPTTTVPTKTGSPSLASKSSDWTTELESPEKSTRAKRRFKRKNTLNEKTGPSTKKSKGMVAEDTSNDKVGPSAKNTKAGKVQDVTGVLKVEDLDVTVESETRTGQIMKFRIQKSRSSGAVLPLRIM